VCFYCFYVFSVFTDIVLCLWCAFCRIWIKITYLLTYLLMSVSAKTNPSDVVHEWNAMVVRHTAVHGSEVTTRRHRHLTSHVVHTTDSWWQPRLGLNIQLIYQPSVTDTTQPLTTNHRSLIRWTNNYISNYVLLIATHQIVIIIIIIIIIIVTIVIIIQNFITHT